MNSAFSPIRVLRQLVLPGVAVIFSLPAGSLSATEILIQNSQGGPHQSNGGAGVAWSVAFEFPETVRVQAIQGWINGFEGDTAAVGIFSSLPADPLLPSLDLKTFSLRGIGPTPPDALSPPARWEGVDGLNWTFGAGTYSIVFVAPFMPYGFGGPLTEGPYPISNSYQTFYDDSWHDNGGPIGLRIYGTPLAPLSSTPEPGTYGLMGSAVLVGMATLRRYRRMAAARKIVGSAAGKESGFNCHRRFCIFVRCAESSEHFHRGAVTGDRRDI